MTARSGLETPLHRSDWNTARFKFLFKRHARPVCEGDGVVTAFRDGIVTLRSKRREDGFTFADKEIGYQGVEPGDLVIHAMDGFAGAIGVSDSRGKCSPVLSVVTPQPGVKADPRFWAYYLRNLALSGFIESLAKGIRERSTDFRWRDAGNLLVNFPDYDTQRSIADFLDHELARIDCLIERKLAFIASLYEREASYSRRLLSGELAEAGARRLTATAWLQAVPDHWRIVPLRYLVKISTGERDTQDRIDDGNYPFYVRSMNVERIDTYSHDEEAVLTSGDGAGVGKIFHHVHGKFELHQRMYAFTRFKGLSGRYFFHFLKTFFHLQMTQWSAKSTVDSVRMPFLKSMLFAVPPEREQADIVAQIDASLDRTSRIVDRTVVSIDRLRELRGVLVAYAVTGQLDIADWGKRNVTDRQRSKTIAPAVLRGARA